MRIWSLHPSHLDRIGLVAGWREALLAQSVLSGRTKGYRQHPQLIRFSETADPIATIGGYLSGLHREATARGYSFNGEKIVAPHALEGLVEVTSGQLDYEWGHLGEKLVRRSPKDAERWEKASPTAHPIFETVDGEVASWERI